MAKRTLAEMLDIMRRDLEDEQDALIAVSDKVELLNESQQETVAEVPLTSLPELFTESTAQVIDSSNRFSLTSLSEIVAGGAGNQILDLLRFPDGMSSVRITDQAFVHLISQVELERLAYLVGVRTNFANLFSINDPRFKFEGNEIEILMTPDASALTLDIKWYRKPLEMVDSTPDTDCELQDYIQLAILDLAISKGFRLQNDTSRESKHFQYWQRRINIINKRFNKTASNTFQKQTTSRRRVGVNGSGVTFIN